MTVIEGRAHVLRQKGAIDRAFARANAVDVNNHELKSDLAKHLCVLISGWLENAAYELARQRCKRHASGPVLSFAISQLAWTKNPTTDTLLTLVGYFDLTWRDNFDSYLNIERSSAVNSIVGLRNDIAHGKWQGTATMSLARVAAYYSQVTEVVDYMSDLLDPVA